MKRSILWLLVVASLAGLLAVGGCSSSSDKSFDPDDIAIVASNATIDGSNVIWSMTVSNISDFNADLKLSVKLRPEASGTFFYFSPVHSEKIGKKETKAFNYVDSGVVVPSGVTSVMAFFGLTATPD